MRKEVGKVIDPYPCRSSDSVSLEKILSEEEQQRLYEDGQTSKETTPFTSAIQQRQEKDMSFLPECSNLTLLSSERKQESLFKSPSYINTYQSKTVENADKSSNDNKNITYSTDHYRLPQQYQAIVSRTKEEKGKNVSKKLEIFEENEPEQKQAFGKRKINNQREEKGEMLQQPQKRSMQKYEKFVVDPSEISKDKKLEKLLKPLDVKDILNDMDHDWKFARDEMTDGFFFGDNGYNTDGNVNNNINVASSVLNDDCEHESPKEWIRALDKYIQNLVNGIATRKEKFQLAEKLFKKLAGYYNNVLLVAENSARIDSGSSSDSNTDKRYWQLLVEMINRLQDLEELVKEINGLNIFQKEKLDHVLYYINKDTGWFSSAAIASRPLTMAEKVRQSSDI